MNKNTLLMLATLIFLLVAACINQGEKVTPPSEPAISKMPSSCPQTLSTATPLPKFLEAVYPSGSVTKEEYEKTLTSPIYKGVHISVSANGIDASILKSIDVDYRRNAISDRIQLFVDETFIPNDKSTIFDGLVDAGPFYFGWPVNLSIGFHKAKLIFNIDTGETVNYEWVFCVLP